MPDAAEKIAIQNVASPNHVQRVDKAKYTAMREALLSVLPATAPGMTVADAKSALLKELSQEHFPGGAKAGWWLKAVQLDLEAKGIIARGPKSPVRLFRVGPAG